MKKAGIIGLSAVIMSALLCSCGTQSEPLMESSGNDPFQVRNETISYEFGVGNYDAEKRVMEGNDSVSVAFTYQNGEGACEVGPMIFVNGMVQPYHVGKEEAQTVTAVSLAPNEEKTVLAEFQPVTGNQDEPLSVYFVSMLTPSFLPNGESVSYGNHLKLVQLFPYELRMQNPAPEQTLQICDQYETAPMSSQFQEDYISRDADGNIRSNRLETETFLKLQYAGEKESGTITPNDEVTLQAFGGASCNYRISLFVNNSLVETAFDGKAYLDVTLSSDSICTKPLNLKDIDLKLPEYSHVTLFAVPMNQEMSYSARSVIRSHPVTLKAGTE